MCRLSSCLPWSWPQPFRPPGLPADANVRVVGAVKHAPDDGVGAVVVVTLSLSASDWTLVTIATKGADRGRLGRCWACE